MIAKISDFLDHASEIHGACNGLLPLVGAGLVLLNFLFQIFPLGWLTTSNLFLHLGVILAILGMLLAWRCNLK